MRALLPGAWGRQRRGATVSGACGKGNRSGLTLVTRAGCHLCEDMERELAVQAEALGLAYTLQDVDADPDLQRRYGERVPVLLAAGAELCHYHLDPLSLRRWAGWD